MSSQFLATFAFRHTPSGQRHGGAAVTRRKASSISTHTNMHKGRLSQYREKLGPWVKESRCFCEQNEVFRSSSD